MDAGSLLRALMRDVAWGFFYGWVNFDKVFGTVNHYRTVDVFAGTYSGAMKVAGIDLTENFPTDQVRQKFESMLADWTNQGFDPFVAPQETGSPYGRKHGDNLPAITRTRELAHRCVGLRGDLPLRSVSAVHQSTGPLPMFRRTRRSSTPSPVLKMKCMPSTCPAPRSPGIRPSPLWSKTASCVPPPRNTSCQSFTGTIVSNSSSRCVTRSIGAAITAIPENRSPASS